MRDLASLMGVLAPSGERLALRLSGEETMALELNGVELSMLSGAAWLSIGWSYEQESARRSLRSIDGHLRSWVHARITRQASMELRAAVIMLRAAYDELAEDCDEFQTVTGCLHAHGVRHEAPAGLSERLESLLAESTTSGCPSQGGREAVCSPARTRSQRSGRSGCSRARLLAGWNPAVLTLDALRRGVEELGAEDYDRPAYDERGMASITNHSSQQGVPSIEELSRKMEEIELRWNRCRSTRVAPLPATGGGASKRCRAPAPRPEHLSSLAACGKRDCRRGTALPRLPDAEVTMSMWICASTASARAFDGRPLCGAGMESACVSHG